MVTDLFDSDSELAINHVFLAEQADIFVIAPASANTIAKLANGLSDNPLLTSVLATKSPIVVAPAMDANMFENAATQRNVATLMSDGVFIAGPAEGRLASGLVGLGRMVETSDLLGVTEMVLGRNGDFSGKRIVVSAGGTQEPIDPVRMIGNRSSGKMGYAIAEAARNRGAIVTLVLIANGSAKISKKGLDFIVANDITAQDSGFSVDTNKVTIIHADGTIEKLPLMSKYDVGNAILDRVKTGLNSK